MYELVCQMGPEYPALLKCVLVVLLVQTQYMEEAQALKCYECEKGSANCEDVTSLTAADCPGDDVKVCKITSTARSCGSATDAVDTTDATKCADDATALCCAEDSCNTAAFPTVETSTSASTGTESATIVKCYNCSTADIKCGPLVEADRSGFIVDCAAGINKCKATHTGRSCGVPEDHERRKNCKDDPAAICCTPNTSDPKPCNYQPLPPPGIECYNCSIASDDHDKRCANDYNTTIKCGRTVQMCRLRKLQWVCGEAKEGCKDDVAHCCPGNQCNKVGTPRRLGYEDIAGSKGSEGGHLIPVGGATDAVLPLLSKLLPPVMLLVAVLDL